jgi:hypothetical protein
MAAHPDEARLFQTNWRKLNAVVDSELVKITGVGGKRKTSKRTRRHSKK